MVGIYHVLNQNFQVSNLSFDIDNSSWKRKNLAHDFKDNANMPMQCLNWVPVLIFRRYTVAASFSGMLNRFQQLNKAEVSNFLNPQYLA